MSIDNRFLWLLLLLTVVAAIWPLPEDGGVESVVARRAPDRQRAAPQVASAVSELGALAPQSAARQAEIIELFPRQGWVAPPVAAVPEKPSAPPLPFTYGGLYMEEKKVIIYLNEGTKLHRARQGDTINGTYRVDGITAAAITLTYLPLGQQQTLQTGSPVPK